LWRHPDDHYAVTYLGADGEPCRTGSPAALDLLDRFPGEGTPWQRAVAERREVLAQWDDLSADLQAAAGEVGMRGCMVMPVHDQLHDVSALVIGWSSRIAQDASAHRYALEQMVRSLDIVMQWRGHLAGLERAARVDSLSGLANRAEFFRCCAAELASRRDEHPGVAVLYVDLDGFKAVNDSAGHAHGDAVIVETAARLAGVVRRGDLVARLGGDEFAVLCVGVSHPDEVTAIAARIVDAIAEPMEHDGVVAAVGASVGVAVALPDETDPDGVVARADGALYRAKAEGRGRWVLAV
jgi:diguanylate cyclase (GGDEF)-like protein